MPTATLPTERELLAELTRQGFDHRRGTRGHVIIHAKDGDGTISVATSNLRGSTTTHTRRRILSELRNIGFDFNGAPKRPAHVRSLAEPMAGETTDMTLTRHGIRFRVLPIEELSIDPEYQRALREAHAQRIAGAFDVFSLGSLTVSDRGDGQLVVVDGQHRLRAMHIRGWTYDVPCLVVKGMSKAEEAKLFVGLNTFKALRPMDMFRARLAAGDEVAAEVVRITARFNLTLSDSTPRKRMVVRRSAAVTAIYEAAQHVTLERVLRICTEAWGDEEDPYAYAGAIIKALDRMLTMPAWVALISDDRLIKVLREHQPKDLLRAATAQMQSLIGRSLDRPKALVSMFFDLYNRGQAPSKQLPSGPQRKHIKYGGAA